MRLLVTRSVLGQPDSDEAVGILMARHLAHGQFVTFVWGQNYGGSLAAVVEAPFIGLFGHPIVVARLANIAMALAAAVVLRSIGRRLVSPWAGDIAAVGFWLFPATWLRWTTRDYEFWIPGLLVALLTVWTCLRWDEDRKDPLLWPIGLFAGLSFWAYPLLGCIILPALVGVAWANRKRPVALAKHIALAPIGAAPWLLANLADGFSSLHGQLGVTVKEHFTERALHAVTILLPTTFLAGNGFRVSADRSAEFGWAVAAAAAAFAFRAVWRRNVKLSLVTVPLFIWPVFLAASKVPEPPSAGRYSYIVLPTLFLLVGWAVSSIPGNAARTAVAVVLAALAIFVTVRYQGRASSRFRAVPSTDPSLTRLIGYLETTGQTHVYAIIGLLTSFRSTVRSGSPPATLNPVATALMPRRRRRNRRRRTCTGSGSSPTWRCNIG